MADTKVSALAALTGAGMSNADQLVIIDKSDTTMGAGGTDKNMTAQEFTRGMALLGLMPTVTDRIGSLLVIGHSWNAGTALSATGTPQFERQGVVGRLCGLLKIHESNQKNLAIQGTCLARTVGGYGELFGGWAGVYAFDTPYSSPLVSDTATVILPNPALASPYTTLISHGINDANYYASLHNPTNYAAVRRGWKCAMEAVLSRRRAGALYSSTRTTAGAIQWDPTIAFGGTWADVASIGQNTGPAYKTSAVNGSTVTFTIPATFTGGTVVFSFISQGNGWTTTNGALTNVATTVNIVAPWNGVTAEFVSGANYVIVVDDGTVNNAEQMLVTGGQGTTAWTVTRGFNGTAQVSHLTGAQVTGLATGARVDFSGTASVTGTSLPLQNQGFGGSPVACVRRITGLVPADAGKTIVATVAGIVGSDTATLVQFDSVWIETDTPPPVAVEKIVRYSYSAGYESPQDYADLETDTDTVVSSFADHASYICRPDTDSPFWLRSGLLTGSITSTTTSFNVVANDVTTFGTLPAGTTFCIQGERLIAKTITFVSGSTYTLDCVSTANRGVDGTAANAHGSNVLCSDGTWMHADGVHPNGYGHAVRADTIFASLNSLTTVSTRQIAVAAAATTQDQHTPVLGLIDNCYIQPAVAGTANNAPTINTLFFIALYIPQTCILDGMALWQQTAGTAGSIVRMGVYDTDVSRCRPGGLIAEIGTGTTVTATTAQGVAPGNCYHILEPGIFYFAAVIQVAATGTCRMTGTTAMINNQYCIASIPTGSQNLVGGYAMTGQTGALPASASSLVDQVNVPILYPHVRTKAFG